MLLCLVLLASPAPSKLINEQSPEHKALSQHSCPVWLYPAATNSATGLERGNISSPETAYTTQDT